MCLSWSWGGTRRRTWRRLSSGQRAGGCRGGCSSFLWWCLLSLNLLWMPFEARFVLCLLLRRLYNLNLQAKCCKQTKKQALQAWKKASTFKSNLLIPNFSSRNWLNWITISGGCYVPCLHVRQTNCILPQSALMHQRLSVPLPFTSPALKHVNCSNQVEALGNLMWLPRMAPEKWIPCAFFPWECISRQSCNSCSCVICESSLRTLAKNPGNGIVDDSWSPSEQQGRIVPVANAPKTVSIPPAWYQW